MTARAQLAAVLMILGAGLCGLVLVGRLHGAVVWVVLALWAVVLLVTAWHADEGEQ